MNGPPPPPCGLPQFIDKLPGDAQKKLQDIWQNYKQGVECHNKRGETRELGPPPPPCALPQFIDKLPGDAQKKLQDIWQNYKQGVECHNKRGETRELLSSLSVEVHRTISKHSPLPPPLMKAPKDVQEHFRAVLDDNAIPCGGKRKKMHELAQKVL
ncbi:hypothetical protein ANCDUO_07753 [Ancylostoma duodenale]|uniref:Uncharacterized protein n=1 Tax=Ancylostoma duodenale TaxID=51022 RepID=A0A0C2GXU9_9BILA|nr:hypothetical protein ANCDUO_07753 [Ancylostoma duodenale]